MSRSTCFHCGAPIRGPSPEMEFDGARVALCSPACAEIALRIRDDGLGDFYRFRTGASAPAPAGSARWSGFDREALQREFVVAQGDGTREAALLVQGVRCAACSWLIERAMAGTPGVREIAVDPLTTRARLRWDPAVATLGALLARIAALGYEPCPYTEQASDRAALGERRASLRRLVVAGLGMSEVMSYATAMYAGALQGMPPAIEEFLRLVSLLVATPVVFYAATPFYRGAWRGLRSAQPGMDLPVALAVLAAYAASVWNTFSGSGPVYFDSAVMFVFFLSCARFLEQSGRHRALGLTGALAQHLPRVATRLTNGRPGLVGVAELVPGDLVLVPAGQSVPVDGSLVGDAARFDESLLTGESRPVHKTAGDPVVAGSINLMDAATVRVERVGAGTVLAQIGRLVAAAGAQRPRLVQLTDRVARWFVGGVLVLAVAVGVAWWFVEPARAFEVVLAVLVVTCPCALALGTPAAFTVGTSALARQGVLLRRAGALETLARATDMVFDKTGTLTEHSAGIRRIEALDGDAPERLLALAAALESRSAHPLAKAFPPPDPAFAVTDVVAVPGQGLQGRVDGSALRIGTRGFAAGPARHTPAATTGSETQEQWIWLGGERGLLGRFQVAEQIRPGAAESLAALGRLGLHVTIASGDQTGPVANVARRLGVTDWRAGLRPEDKLALVRELQQAGRVVAMVGDGINDSPVLAGADVAVAIGSGAALAQHAADLLLVGNAGDALPGAVRQARRTMRVVRQNLGWALAYNLVAVPLAATGLLAPWLAALGMSLSSLLVTFNALRLARPAGAPAATTGHRLLGERAVTP